MEFLSDLKNLCSVIDDIFYNSMKNDKEAKEPKTLAAHFDGEEYTEEELVEIKKFAEFVKSKRKQSRPAQK